MGNSNPLSSALNKAREINQNISLSIPPADEPSRQGFSLLAPSTWKLNIIFKKYFTPPEGAKNPDIQELINQMKALEQDLSQASQSHLSQTYETYQKLSHELEGIKSKLHKRRDLASSSILKNLNSTQKRVAHRVSQNVRKNFTDLREIDALDERANRLDLMIIMNATFQTSDRRELKTELKAIVNELAKVEKKGGDSPIVRERTRALRMKLHEIYANSNFHPQAPFYAKKKSQDVVGYDKALRAVKNFGTRFSEQGDTQYTDAYICSFFSESQLKQLEKIQSLEEYRKFVNGNTNVHEEALGAFQRAVETVKDSSGRLNAQLSEDSVHTYAYVFSTQSKAIHPFTSVEQLTNEYVRLKDKIESVGLNAAQTTIGELNKRFKLNLNKNEEERIAVVLSKQASATLENLENSSTSAEFWNQYSKIVKMASEKLESEIADAKDSSWNLFEMEEELNLIRKEAKQIEEKFESYFQSELKKSSHEAKELMKNLQGLMGPHYQIPPRIKYFVLQAIQEQPKEMETWIRHAERSQKITIQKLNQEERQNPYAIVRRYPPPSIEKAECAAAIADLNNVFLGKIGSDINTQILTDSLETQFIAEPEDSTESRHRDRTRVATGTAHTRSKDEASLIDQGYLPYDMYWSRASWDFEESKGVCTLGLAIKGRPPVERQITLDLSDFHGEDLKNAIRFVKAYCNSEGIRENPKTSAKEIQENEALRDLNNILQNIQEEDRQKLVKISQDFLENSSIALYILFQELGN